jgi:hypothetical protein
MSQTFGGSQVGLNPYLLNIIPLQNIANPEQGIITDNLSNTVRNVTTMINPVSKTLRTSNILPYTNGGAVNMTGRFNVNGVLTVNGAFIASNTVISNITNVNTITSSNSLNLECGSTLITLASSFTTAPPASAVPAISFITAGNTSFSLDTANRALYKGDGSNSNVNYMWVSSSVLHADRLAINHGGINTMSTIFDVWGGDAYFASSIFVRDDVHCANLYQVSDRRVKSNITSVESALERVTQLNGVHYDINGKYSYGFIAQEVKEIIPEAVKVLPSGLLTLDYSQILPIVVEAIKELQLKISDVNSKSEQA